MVADATVSLEHDDQVKLFIGASEVEGRVRVSAERSLQVRGFVQIRV